MHDFSRGEVNAVLTALRVRFAGFNIASKFNRIHIFRKHVGSDGMRQLINVPVNSVIMNQQMRGITMIFHHPINESQIVLNIVRTDDFIIHRHTNASFLEERLPYTREGTSSVEHRFMTRCSRAVAPSTGLLVFAMFIPNYRRVADRTVVELNCTCIRHR